MDPIRDISSLPVVRQIRAEEIPVDLEQVKNDFCMKCSTLFESLLKDPGNPESRTKLFSDLAIFESKIKEINKCLKILGVNKQIEKFECRKIGSVGYKPTISDEVMENFKQIAIELTNLRADLEGRLKTGINYDINSYGVKDFATLVNDVIPVSIFSIVFSDDFPVNGLMNLA